MITKSYNCAFSFTAESVTRQTVDAHVLLKDLFPGAGYEIKVYAISHDLWSEPHVYFQAVCKFFSSLQLSTMYST